MGKPNCDTRGSCGRQRSFYSRFLFHVKEKELTAFPSLDWADHSVVVCVLG